LLLLQLFLDLVFHHHGLPESIVSDRDPRFTSPFWMRLFQLLGTRLLMSTAAHPETDGQTERVNRVLEDVLRSYATSFISWGSFLPMAEFALNNATHSSTGLTPFFVNNARSSSSRRARFHQVGGLHSWWGRIGTDGSVGADIE
jgi:transposase InsO family protein